MSSVSLPHPSIRKQKWLKDFWTGTGSEQKARAYGHYYGFVSFNLVFDSFIFAIPPNLCQSGKPNKTV